jgi:hypothetical protein
LKRAGVTAARCNIMEDGSIEFLYVSESVLIRHIRVYPWAIVLRTEETDYTG